MKEQLLIELSARLIRRTTSKYLKAKSRWPWSASDQRCCCQWASTYRHRQEFSEGVVRMDHSSDDRDPVRRWSSWNSTETSFRRPTVVVGGRAPDALSRSTGVPSAGRWAWPHGGRSWWPRSPRPRHLRWLAAELDGPGRRHRGQPQRRPDATKERELSSCAATCGAARMDIEILKRASQTQPFSATPGRGWWRASGSRGPCGAAC